MPNFFFSQCLKKRGSTMARRKIKKAERKVKRLKAPLTEQMKEELTQWANIWETRYQEIVQTREVACQLILDFESSDAQLLELISALLGENDGDLSLFLLFAGCWGG